MKWDSYMYTFIPSFLDLTYTPLHPTPFSSEHWAELPVLHIKFPQAVCIVEMWMNLDSIMQSEVSQKSKYCIVTYVYGI